MKIEPSIRRTLQSPSGRALLYALGMLLAGTGCAHATGQNKEDTSTHPAVLDFGSCAKPEYPQADLQARHEGTVALHFLVNPDGSVGDSKVLNSSRYTALDEAARTALARCRFHPAAARGKRVKEWTKVMYVWSLK
jgi:TonB family protein